MRVLLQIIKGESRDVDKTFEYVTDEPDNVTFGRSATEDTKDGRGAPHVQLSTTDISLSHRHFMLMLRPPNCFIQDMNSLNHVYINDFRPNHFIKDTVLLKDGDEIKAGKTYLKITIKKKEREWQYRCNRCGKSVEAAASKRTEKKELICDECRDRIFTWERQESGKKPGFLSDVLGKSKEEGQKREHRRPSDDYKISLKKLGTCCSVSHCKKDLSNYADNDGKAQEFHDIALYLCNECAEKQKNMDEVIKNYQFLSVLGRGGSSEVYLARHEFTYRLVAIKKILPDKEMQRYQLLIFQREVGLAKDLVHPNLIRFYDYFNHKKYPYLVTEYLPGGNVADCFGNKERQLDSEKSCQIILEILDALSFLHGKGIVHRDVKPQNFLFTADGRVKLSDLGLAKSIELAGQSGITSSGIMGGTIPYIAPEQITNYRFVKTMADVYSAGVSLYFMLTRRYPYSFSAMFDLAVKQEKKSKLKNPLMVILEEEPISILNVKPELNVRLAQVIDKCIQKNPHDRYADASQMKSALITAISEDAEN